jgi:hypothetical protein
MITHTAKWASLPVLVIASMFSRFASGYELLVDLAVCLCAIIFLQRAVWLKDYSLAAGFAVVALAFSPLVLIVKILALMTLAAVAFCINLSAFRTRAVMIRHS